MIYSVRNLDFKDAWPKFSLSTSCRSRDGAFNELLGDTMIGSNPEGPIRLSRPDAS